MWDIRGFLEVSRTVSAAVTCLCFLGALLKQVETRKRNAMLFIWILAALLLVSVSEAAVMIVRSGGLPNIQPMAATLLYILGLLLQIDYLWTPTNEENKPAWHAFLGSWIAMAVFELLAIVELTVVPPSSSVELICGAVAVSLRSCLEVVLFITFAQTGGRGYIRLGDYDAFTAVENGTVASSGGDGERSNVPELNHSVRDEIRAAGGVWPWFKEFRIFLPWIWPSGMLWMKIRIVVAQLLLPVEIALAVYTPYVNGYFMETIVQTYTDSNLHPVWKALGRLLVIRFAGSDVGISSLRVFLWEKFKQSRQERAEKIIFAYLMDHDAEFHDTTTPNDIVDASDMGLAVCEALDFILMETVPLIIKTVVTMSTVFARYGAHVALAQVTVIAIYTLVILRSSRISMSIWDERIMAWRNTRRRRERGLKGWRTVTFNGRAKYEIDEHTSSLRTQMKLVMKSFIYSIAGKFSSAVVLLFGEFAITALVILHEFPNGGTVGAVVEYNGYWSILKPALRFFIDIPDRIGRRCYEADRLRRLLKAKSRMKYGPNELRVAGGRVEFKNVTFGYTSAKLIFNNLNLVIEPGETTAIVGESGSGKSSALNLMSELYQPQKGSIEIDGQDIKTVRRDDVSKHVAVMPQSPHLFNDTIRNNIKYRHPDATDSNMHEAAERAGIHSTIMALDKQYDTIVGEGGVNFSGGERQRIALARILVPPEPYILLLDEPTSSLDVDSEDHIKHTLKAVFGKRHTVVIVAHRLSTIKDADKIVVFKKGENGCGEIAEIGKHDELLKQDGIYARLWRTHSGVAKTERAIEELFDAE